MKTQELINSTLQILRSQNRTPDTQPITAARVGSLLRRSFGGAVWKEVGFASLKSFLEELERQGHLRIGQTDRQALAVQLGDSGEFHLEPPSENSGLKDHTTRPLRKPYWIAFALEQPTGRRFLNPSTGELLVGADDDVKLGEGWIEVAAIDSETQRAWANRFLNDNGVEVTKELAKALESEEWYREFPMILRSHPGHLGSKWNRERSKHVALEVKNWCKTNGVPIQSAFQLAAPGAKDYGRRSQRKMEIGEFRNEEKARRVVLNALSSAPTDWLLELPIPVKYILRALDNSGKRA